MQSITDPTENVKQRFPGRLVPSPPLPKHRLPKKRTPGPDPNKGGPAYQERWESDPSSPPILHWLSGSFHQASLEQIEALLGPLASVGKVRPWEGGVFISLSGSVLASRSQDLPDLQGWLKALQAAGFRATRIDLALDDRKGLLDLEVLNQAFRKGHFTTRFKKGKNIKGFRFRTQGPQEDGSTISFGEPSSESHLNIYDKAKEQKVGGHWVRVELKLCQERAQAALSCLVEGGPGFIPGLIGGYVDFKEFDPGDSNKRRWPTASWWAEFLGNPEKVTLALPPPKPKNTEAAFRHQWGLFLARKVLEEGFSWLEELVSEQIDRYNHRQGKPKFRLVRAES